MRIRSGMVAVCAAVACGSATAAGVGARIGTTGIGADVGFEVLPTLSVRAGYSYWSFSRDFDDTNVKYEGDIRLSNPSLLLDWSPFPVPFRFTGGLMFSNNGVSVTGQPTGGTFTINGVVYPASAIGSLSGEIKAGYGVKPYLGIGYGNVAGKGVNFYFDLGVAFTGTPSATLSVACGSALTEAQCTRLRDDVAVEARELQDSVSRYKYYPVANIGVTIGF